MRAENPRLESRSAARRRAPQRRTDERPSKARSCDLSVVIPLFNEEGNIAELCERLARVLQGQRRTWEILFVDDGSHDGTSAEIAHQCSLHRQVRAVRLRRNFGQTAAMAAGFDHARGSIIVTMDGDLQNPPEDIPRLLAKLEEGYDLVSGWRVDRRDPFLRRVFPSRVANWVIGWVTGTRLHDYGCSLKAYRREIVEELQLHGDMHRFIPAFAGALGARIAEIPVRHSSRRNGRSKYGLLRTFIVLVDMISIRFLLPYTFKPLKLFGMVGAASLALGCVINAYLAYIRLFLGHPLAGRPLLLLGLLLTILGVQLIVLGILAELQVRTLLTAGEKTYAVREHLGQRPEPQRPEPQRADAGEGGGWEQRGGGAGRRKWSEDAL
jgi:glycosyltransferase involved in cell wall biosynthesis